MSDAQYATVLAQTIELVSRHCERSVSKDSRFTTDLSLDSVGTMDLIAELEDHFHVRFSFEEARELETVGDAARYVTALLSGETTQQRPEA